MSPLPLSNLCENQGPSRCFRLPSHLSCPDPLADPGANSRDQLHLSGYISAPPMVNLVADQFAFRPTGSTTAALIDLLHNMTVLLQHNEYVALFSVDFTKAFDSVKHLTLVQKLQLLDLPDHVFNWLVDYFEGRGHATRLGDAISLVAGINASIIQGSVVGPPSYVIVASDL